MSAISTHVLDTSVGRPAAGISAVLEVEDGAGRWSEVGRGVTNQDGRISDLLPGGSLAERAYRLTFQTESYFRSRKVQGFYPEVTILFRVHDATQHHHVPLLLSPYGYSTYRGS